MRRRVIIFGGLMVALSMLGFSTQVNIDKATDNDGIGYFYGERDARRSVFMYNDSGTWTLRVREYAAPSGLQSHGLMTAEYNLDITDIVRELQESQ